MVEEKNARQKLDNERDNVLDFAQKVIENNNTLQPKTFEYKEMNNIEDLTVNIIALDQAKDEKLGITWHEDGNNRIRDARNINPEDSKFKDDAGEKYAMQILNQVRAGIMLLDQDSSIDGEGKEKAKNALYVIANGVIGQSRPGPEELNSGGFDDIRENIKRTNSNIINILGDAGIKNPLEELNFAKEISSFKDDHKNIVTISKFNDNNIVEADVIVKLTQEQMDQYKVIAQNKGKKISTLRDDKDYQRQKHIQNRQDISPDPKFAWYNELPKYKRKLIASVANDIATGKKVIPAQLRELIGARNAYEKTTAIIVANEKPKVVASALHCGAPASKNENNKEEITKQNIDQLKAASGNKKLRLNILTSQRFRGEGWISKGVRKGAKETDNEVTASPINKWRVFFGGRDQENYKKSLSDLADKLAESVNRKDNQALIKYLKTGKGNFKNIKAELQKLEKNNPMKVGLLAAIETRKNLKESNLKIFGKKKNINAEISADMLVVENSLNDPKALGSLWNGNDSNLIKTVTFCKSGKDRTGLEMVKTTANALNYEWDLDEDNRKKLLKTLAAGGHTQQMAGGPGGTPGCNSIKMSAEFGLTGEDKIMNKIINQDSSKYNSEIKVDENTCNYNKKSKSTKMKDALMKGIKSGYNAVFGKKSYQAVGRS